MSVLRITFPKASFAEEEAALKGLELAFSLAREDSVVILSPGAEAAASGYAVTSFLYTSPITGSLTLGYAPLNAGYALRAEGIDAVVLSGRSLVLSLLSFKDRSVREVPRSRDMGPRQFAAYVRQEPSDTVLSVGPAALNGSVHASLGFGDGEVSAPGLGTVLARMGIKGFLFPGAAEPERKKRGHWLSRKAREYLKEGERVLIGQDLRLGALPVRGWSARKDPRASFFDSKAAIGKARFPGLAEAEALGTNLGLFNEEEVLELSERVYESGIDLLYAGAVLASGGAGREERLSLIRDMAKGARTGSGVLLSERGLPFSLDLRGSFPEAIAAAYELPSVLLSSRLFPSKPLSGKRSAELMLYETVFGYGLLSEGYSPEYALVSYWGRFPAFLYRVPLVTTLPLFFCGRERLRTGLSVLDRLERGPYRLPGAFRLNPVSAYDNRTVRETELLSWYRLQKARLRRGLKVMSEKTSKPSGDSDAAVGPEEDLGLEGEPGLSRKRPSLS